MKDEREYGIEVGLILWWLCAVVRFGWVLAHGRSPAVEGALLQWGSASILLCGRMFFLVVPDLFAVKPEPDPSDVPAQPVAGAPEEGSVRS